jgi:UDP-N-acetylglucosamine--N-acetylmuramyl-(pentapeptide) pyrophosphoryl-undecaprenol N-acetylglucosamine transferase
MERLAIAGGGTGGHLYPGIAVADEAKKHGTEVMFLGVETGIETKVLPGLGYRLTTVKAGKFKGAGVMGKLRTAFGIPIGVMQAKRELGEFRPDLLLGVGGYASLSGVLAAKLSGVPVVIQEQNAMPGLANRMLCRFAKSVALGFRDAESRLGAARECVYTGNPVRSGMKSVDRAEAAAKFGLDPKKKTILVFGGSGGALRINNAMTEALWLMGEEKDGLQIIHQTGAKGYGKVKAAYDKSGFKGVVLQYIDDMGSAYGCADLVVCRSGAMTISELTVLGKPAILIPYPYAADNHQEVNARAMEREGGAVVLPDGEASGQRLMDEINGLLGNIDRLAGMAGRSMSLGRPRAAEAVYELCERYALG